MTQQTEYVGKLGYEKKFHKTHFPAIRRKLKATTPGCQWKKIGVGKYIRIATRRVSAEDANDSTVQ